MSESRIRLLVVDVDGTLLNSRHQLSTGNIAALRSAAEMGVQVALATGRRYSFVLPIADQLGFDPWLLTSNGAMARRCHGPIRFATLLARRRAEEVIAALDGYRGYAVMTFPMDGHGELVMESLELAEAAFPTWLRHNLPLIRFRRPLEAALMEAKTDPVQIMYAGGMELMAEVTAAMVDACLDVRVLQTLYPHRDLAIVDVLDKTVHKGAAVERLAQELGYTRDEVMAIGDNYNDVEMLEFAGRAVLMGNAAAELQRDGWQRTLDNDHDGVAAAIADVISQKL